MYGIKIVGLESLQKYFRDFPKITHRHFKIAMSKSVITIENNVRLGTPVGVTARLRNSIESTVSGTGAELVGRIGSTITKGEIYPLIMEYGRRPGKMPPPSALERWVHIVLKVGADEVKSVAFLVARAIGRRGIKGKFFFKKGWEKSRSRVMKNFEQALHDTVEEVNRGSH